MEIGGNRSEDIVKVRVLVKEWEVGKSWRMCVLLYVGFVRRRKVVDRMVWG